MRNKPKLTNIAIRTALLNDAKKTHKAFTKFPDMTKIKIDILKKLNISKNPKNVKISDFENAFLELKVKPPFDSIKLLRAENAKITDTKN